MTWIWNELWWYPVVSVCSMNQHSWQCLHNDHMTRCPSAMSCLCCPVMSHVRFYHHMPRVGFWMLWWHFNASLSLTMRQGLEWLEGRCGRIRFSLSIHKHCYYRDYFISEPSLNEFSLFMNEWMWTGVFKLQKMRGKYEWMSRLKLSKKCSLLFMI